MTNYRSAIAAGFASLWALSLSIHASTFDEVASHLDLDGSFLAVVDFDGDGQEVGEKLNGLYEQFLATQPDMPPIPIDFPTVFETLGYGSIHAIALSSKELDDRLVRNRSVVLLNGEPTGLVGLYDLGPTEFRAAAFAPGDATTAVSATIRFTTLRDTIQALVIQFLGPIGEGMAQNVIQMPVPGTDVTVDEIIHALSAPLDLVMKQGMKPDGQPDFQIWASVQGAGALLARLQPLSESMPITFAESEQGLQADFSALLQGAAMGLFLEAPAGSDALLIYTHTDWAEAIKTAPERLTDRPEFARVAAQLPENAATYAYSAGFDPTQILAMIEQQPDVQPYMPLIRTAIDAFLGDFLAPYASASYRKGDVLISDQYAQYSIKQAVMVVPTALVAGFGAAAAIPALQKQQAISQEAAVTNNLRQIASAAQQKMLDEGLAEVAFSDLVGPDNYIVEMNSVAGETYEHIVVTKSTVEISVELPDGRLISYVF